METINDRIAFLIKDLGIKRSAFADRLHVSGAFVSGLCSGTRNPSDRTISDICRVFNVSLAWLQDGTGEMYIKRSATEDLAILFSGVLADADESFRKRFVSALLELPPEFWDEAEKFVKKLASDD